MTRNRLRLAALVRKVLLPPVIAGAAVACVLAALAVTVANGSRPRAGNPLGGSGRGSGSGSASAGTSRIVVAALSADIEGTPAPGDVRRARKPLPERLRLLGRHPYYRLYVRAQRRYRVPWVLVAAVHYQETGFERRADQTARVMAIAGQLRAAHASVSLGDRAARAVARRYGATPGGRVSTAMVIERARAWRLLGALPALGRGELATPVAGVVGGCGYFGCPRPGHLHNGVDFLAPYGVPVHAADAGQVAFVQAPGASGGYGNFVCLQHRPHLATCYAHLGAIAEGIVQGARVRRGQVIGLVGSTGSSSAPHLHFEARLGPAACHDCAVDPLALLSGNVPQSRVPRMLRASTSAVVPGLAAAPAPARVPLAAGPQAPAARSNPTAPGAPASRADVRRSAPATQPGRPAPTGGASVPASPGSPGAHGPGASVPASPRSPSAAHGPGSSVPASPRSPSTARAPAVAPVAAQEGGARPSAEPAASAPARASPSPAAAGGARPPG